DGAVPDRRRAARDDAAAQEPTDGDHLADQGAVGPGHRRAAAAAGRPPHRPHAGPRGRHARLDAADGVRREGRDASVRQAVVRAPRSILRQDPDVIMVGEIRDSETADIAVKSALTGHLVLSTVHANDAPGTVTRLIDMGVARYLVGSAVTLVMAQRLVRRVCD